MLIDLHLQITELKAQMYETDKEFRTKVQAMQRNHATAIENLQVRIWLFLLLSRVGLTGVILVSCIF